jgi:hypothetical protein
MNRGHSAKCGHVKRQLRQGRRLSGEVLEFALSVLPQSEVRRAGKDEFYDLLDGVRQKLLSGQKLTDYEEHIYFDVILVSERIYG